MNIKAVLFDADGVVIHPWRFANHLESIGIKRQMIRDFFQGIFRQCLLGQEDLKTVLPPFLKTWGWSGSVDAFVDLWFNIENAPDERVINIIHTLRQHGYICCLGTLQETHRAAYMRDIMGFADLFDHLFFSCEIGFTKQERTYYQYISHTLGFAPDQILFWDDSASNVDCARKAGLQAEVYSDFETFETRIKTLFPGEV
jgi:putative hydrolase of the HAD superfamily